ncbi:MAG: restriction endonuclease [Cyanobacteria bacterium J06638_7]
MTTAIPKFHEFFTPVLQVLRDRGQMTRRDLVAAVIEHLAITPQQMAESIPSDGNSVVAGRIGWSLSYLCDAQALHRPARATYELGSTAAQILALDHPLTLAELKAMPAYKQAQEAKSASRPATDASDPVEESTPQELIAAGIARLDEQLAGDLLERLKQASPERFEKAVLQLLVRMGYGGGDERSMRTVARGADGGIDGAIKEDPLGLDRIYIQAKRHKEGAISRPVVQGFVGAMSCDGCRKGVFATTSRFTNEAIEWVNSLRDTRVILIAGAKFATLMIRHGVGVQVRETFKVGGVDEDFFAEDDG